MKVRITGNVNYNTHLLETHEVYDIPDSDALEMIKYQLAELYEGERTALIPGESKPREIKPVDHYVAEATEVDPEKKKKLEEIGKLKEVLEDDKPVIPPTHEPEADAVVDDPEAGKGDQNPQTPAEETPSTPVEPEKPAADEVVINDGPRSDAPAQPENPGQSELPPDDSSIGREH